MGRKHWRSLIYVIVLIIGLMILMNSLNWGSNEASNIMRFSYFGSMDTNTYSIYLAQAITKYRVLGAVLSILGGFGALLNWEH